MLEIGSSVTCRSGPAVWGDGGRWRCPHLIIQGDRCNRFCLCVIKKAFWCTLPHGIFGTKNAMWSPVLLFFDLMRALLTGLRVPREGACFCLREFWVFRSKSFNKLWFSHIFRYFYPFHIMMLWKCVDPSNLEFDLWDLLVPWSFVSNFTMPNVYRISNMLHNLRKAYFFRFSHMLNGISTMSYETNSGNRNMLFHGNLVGARPVSWVGRRVPS